jgi:hypothetical protein
MIAAAGCVSVQLSPTGESSKSKPAAGKPPAKPDEKPAFKPWDEVLKDTRAIDGFIKAHLKRDRTLYFELPAAQLEHDLGLLLQIGKGLGEFNIQEGLPLSESLLVRFERVGDTVRLVQRNPRFVSAASTPARFALEENRGDAVIESFKIESEHPGTKNLLIDLTGFVLSDYAGLADELKGYFNDRPVNLVRANSIVERAVGFPMNTEIDALLNFRASDPPSSESAGVADTRSMPIGVRLSWFQLPEQAWSPRYADDRIGHFYTAIWDWERIEEYSPFQRFIQRWRLQKVDPTQTVSEVVRPIVYYIDPSVPLAYRQAVREAVEAWKPAFEDAGFRNAIVVKDAPSHEEDPNWSPEDIRYSTIRWTAGYNMGYAIGPRQIDPRTGEILNADILVSSTFVRAWRNDWLELRPAVQSLDAPPLGSDSSCQIARGLAEQLSFGQTALAALGAIDPGEPVPTEIVSQGVRWVVMHEVGHTLGLRHNFRASSVHALEALSDRRATAQRGLAGSVMDYLPMRLAADRSRQGDYFMAQVGAYDRWAIQYAYAVIPEQTPDGPLVATGAPARDPDLERAGLAKIARRSTEPMLAFGSDEDGGFGPHAVDPYVNVWDLGADPIAFAKERNEIIDRAVRELDRISVPSGESYSRSRAALDGLIGERMTSLLPLTKMIGGMKLSRAHKGDPDAPPPLVPIASATQRAALDTLLNLAFAEGSLIPPTTMLDKLAPSRWLHWGTDRAPTVDYPLHRLLGQVQAALLDSLFQPARLTRLIDQELQTASEAKPFRLNELIGQVSISVWSELAASGSARSISAPRRQLQRLWLNKLSALALAPAPSSPDSGLTFPEDARALARYELDRVRQRLSRTLQGSLDETTRAHLSDIEARITRALAASYTIPVRN